MQLLPMVLSGLWWAGYIYLGMYASAGSNCPHLDSYPKHEGSTKHANLCLGTQVITCAIVSQWVDVHSAHLRPGRMYVMMRVVRELERMHAWHEEFDFLFVMHMVLEV